MGRKSKKLFGTLTRTQRLADKTRESFMLAEDGLTALEDREQRRASRRAKSAAGVQHA